MKLAKMTRPAVAAVAMWMLAASAAAEGDMPVRRDGLHGSLGLGVGVRPAYEGASDKKTRIMPNINLFYGDTLFLTGMMAGANLWKHTTAQGLSINAGPLLALRRGRDEGDNAGLAGLGDIDRSLDVGGFVRFRKGGWQARADIRKDVSNGDGGTTVNLSAGYGMPVAQKLRLRANLDTTWASAAYANTFYGIDATQAANSGLAQYEAGSGIKSVGASLMADYVIDREWGAYASLRYKRLVGDAADSPIVAGFGSESQVTTSVGIKYRF
ncbi:MAG: MipA/OmpV family protein [Gammaproteobacteria bacterium]|nr:MipA/OmpV family protein [Gammaproteobacteria bacterium]MBU1646449.1 MipA/OmpV family protein [Gammaproteobacteria bacterium]MBU1970992.1 MipA/OmpV family protein [Gammaproteobacteria bacterium]